MKRLLALIPACFWLAPVLARAPEPPPSPPAAPSATISAATAEALMKDIVVEVERIRGLRFKKPVPVKVVGDADTRAHVLARLETMTSREEIEADSAAYRLLGLLPPGVDLLESLLGVLEEQVGGYYDPEAETFYLLDDMPAAAASILMAHELTHALEDQHFDLDRRLRGAKADDDRLFAYSAVHEGSATLLMGISLAEALAQGRMKLDALQAFAETEAGRGEKLAALPAVLRRNLMGSYLLGAAFFGGVGGGAGFPAERVTQAYRDGPTTSEQILHPDRFWKERDLPRAVTLGQGAAALGEGWRQVADGTLGELTLGVLVGAPTPSDMTAAAMSGPAAWTNEAATGWDGDRWELWQREGKRIVLLATAWDSAADAGEFEAALPARPDRAVRRVGDSVFLVAGEGASPILDRLVPPAAKTSQMVPDP
jgi:hypothetical protein